MRGAVVIKVGGHAAVDRQRVCADVAEIVATGTPVVLVHGGSADIEALAARLGVPSRRLVAPDGVSTRHTDAAMLDVLVQALAGITKPRLLQDLAAAGVRAVGLTGLDAGLLRARRKHAHRAVIDGRLTVVRDDHSGRVVTVATDVLQVLHGSGIVPVISPPVVAEDGHPVNADADRVAAAVAVAVDAVALLLLTGAPGVLAEAGRPDTLLPVCAVGETGPPPVVSGGMGTKLIAAREALLGGVPRVLVADGREPRPVQSALAGRGTTIMLRAEPAPVAP
jgi:acetylglutamate/LysW-gamma-L-alpha-aminoadipate kinase